MYVLSAPGTVSACCTCHMRLSLSAPGAVSAWHLSYVSSICVYCGAWSAPNAVSACCTWHVCWLYVCIVVLGAHLVLSVLAALIYVLANR